MINNPLKSELIYIGRLLDAAWNGANRPNPSKPISAEGLCLLTAVGSAMGALAAVLEKPRRARHVRASAVIGGAVGLCVGAVWQNRSTVGAAARSAMHEVNTARDMHWLDKHPIAYG